MKQVRVLEMIDKAFLGGGQINLLSLVDFLPEAEFQISVCTAESGPLVDELKKRGIPHFPAALSRKFRLKTRIRLQRIFQRHHFDIIHTHGGVAGFYARTAAGRDRRF